MRILTSPVPMWVFIVIVGVLLLALIGLGVAYAQMATLIRYHELTGERYIDTGAATITRGTDTLSDKGTWVINFTVSETAAEAFPTLTPIIVSISINGGPFVRAGIITATKDRDIKSFQYDTNSPTYPSTIVIKVD